MITRFRKALCGAYLVCSTLVVQAALGADIRPHPGFNVLHPQIAPNVYHAGDLRAFLRQGGGDAAEHLFRASGLAWDVRAQELRGPFQRPVSYYDRLIFIFGGGAPDGTFIFMEPNRNALAEDGLFRRVTHRASSFADLDAHLRALPTDPRALHVYAWCSSATTQLGDPPHPRIRLHEAWNADEKVPGSILEFPRNAQGDLPALELTPHETASLVQKGSALKLDPARVKPVLRELLPAALIDGKGTELPYRMFATSSVAYWGRDEFLVGIHAEGTVPIGFLRSVWGEAVGINRARAMLGRH